jgi:signal transduction histidine kinase
VALDVTDTGSGMDPVTVTHLFEPFFTTKGVGQGTGLGLASAQGIVSEAGGWIDVTTTPGAGSRFRVCWPVATGVPTGQHHGP